ncbi:Rv3654c family TadE-like protein [Phytomonospora sp. NPDC050363]|uniref:Rv3654c family TadE-like protein n=1 Tax=Phytomonospora sp. NPDC050363 TaxID=3155642 RepID=UPI0033C2E35A
MLHLRFRASRHFPRRRFRRSLDRFQGLLRRRSRAGGDSGAVSVSALGVGLSVLLFALLGVTLGAALHARHQAQSAADFAALAAASRALEGQQTACTHARNIAAANNATVTSCVITGLEATVTVEVTPGFVPAAELGGQAIASARAGPVWV